jgi:predicted amidohydrolase
MRVGYVQTKPEFGNKKYNIDSALGMIENVDADLLVLPELFSTGYFFPSKEDLAKLSESIPDGKTVRIFKSLAKKKKCSFVIGIAENKSGRYYNSSAYITPGGDVYLYRKVHLFYKEQFIFARGNLKFRVFPFHEFKLGMMICFDYIFPEACRVLALKGADIVCHPSNLVLHYCQITMPIRSIENRIFTITTNRVGSDTVGDETLKFTGMSQVTDPDGNVLARASGTRPAVKIVDIDPARSRQKMATKYNHILDDRRPEFYKDLLK